VTKRPGERESLYAGVRLFTAVLLTTGAMFVTGWLRHHRISEQVDAAAEEQARVGRSLGRVLVDLGMVTESQLVAALATQIGLPFVDLTDYPVDGSAVAAIPDSVSRRYTALGIGYEEGRIVVAMADPANVIAVDDIRSLTGREVKPVVGTKADIVTAINRYHRADGDLDAKLADNHWVSIPCGRSRTRIAGMSRESFPELPQMPAPLATIPASLLSQMIGKTIFAISSEESRFTLNGALLLVRENSVIMVATDGHRLSMVQQIADMGTAHVA